MKEAWIARYDINESDKVKRYKKVPDKQQPFIGRSHRLRNNHIKNKHSSLQHSSFNIHRKELLIHSSFLVVLKMKRWRNLIFLLNVGTRSNCFVSALIKIESAAIKCFLLLVHNHFPCCKKLLKNIPSFVSSGSGLRSAETLEHHTFRWTIDHVLS